MFPNINSVKKLRFDRAEELQAVAAPKAGAVVPNDSIATILKAFGSSIDEQPRVQMREPTADWSVLIERIRSSATRVRAVEAQAREKEEQFEAILERARADMMMAEDRIRAAEIHASQIEASASLRIRAAEERADAAEERAQVAESWLRRIHETIYSEFSVIDEAQG